MSLSFFRNTFLKSRIINTAFQSKRVMAQMVKSDLENPDEYFLKNNSMKYNELNFYSIVAQNYNVPASAFSGKNELQKFNESKQLLQEYQELSKLIQNLSDFYWELKTIYLELSRNVATSNFHNKHEHTHQMIESDIKDSLHKYVNLMNNLKDYPLWQDKVLIYTYNFNIFFFYQVRDDIGYYAHMIYTSLNYDSQFQSIFDEFDKVDKNYFFK
ncbi:hypothetical protein IMG5_109590 [Ichthyophthirius multifiliis]|uniref:Uncharacterized protein n=1 Tax=Ichthyophthirius multifiliis TaxID=5932 RepID=G0QTL5_ICHMU|nr:hypothetical protein IMG5_109590 [Ichthyophthirius multifiliis]EGR31441.1 hypothetical protein IMG5_109590 [Ichthyophthirius multifiliis]|eukprot:XP_004034927.1 hypothetical protein IMG5_109590 [Ichthyophthirius multifiliis]